MFGRKKQKQIVEIQKEITKAIIEKLSQQKKSRQIGIMIVDTKGLNAENTKKIVEEYASMMNEAMKKRGLEIDWIAFPDVVKSAQVIEIKEWD